LITPLELSSVVAQLDLAGASKGVVRVNLTLTLPEGVTQEGVVKISGVLSEASDSGGRPGN